MRPFVTSAFGPLVMVAGVLAAYPNPHGPGNAGVVFAFLSVALLIYQLTVSVVPFSTFLRHMR